MSRSAWRIRSLLLAAALAGCTSTAAKSPEFSQAALANQNLTLDEAVSADPSSVTLQDISGDLLLYYAVNKALPAHLEDLRSLSNETANLNLLSPVSHQEYVYVPDGLFAFGSDKRVIVYDPAPTPKGVRWCILYQPTATADAPISLNVASLPEAAFQSYQPPGQ
jgi:hypothetical protein